MTHVGVVGAGTMGAGIAQLAARSGLTATLCDTDAAALARAGDEVATTTALAGLARCDVIVEAVPERLDLKATILTELARVAPAAVLASNTSSIPIAALAAATPAPERVLGLHFFNPPHKMKLVELVRTGRTDPGAVERARAVAVALGREVVDVADGPGFLVNRCARPFYLEALRMVEDGVATPAAIDRACVEHGAFRMGPFELMDLIGIDVGLAVTRSMWEQSFGEPRWRPSALQVAQVAAGRLGRKTGGGFYAGGASWRDVAEDGADGPALLERIVAMLVNEAAFAVGAGVASAEDVDRAMVIGLGHPRGPFAWCDELGADHVVGLLDALWAREHDPRYRVAPELRRRTGSYV